MTTRRQLLAALGAVGVTLSFTCHARQADRKTTRRIGWLEPGTPAAFPARRQAFQAVMREGGFAEGRNLVVDYRYASGKLEQFPALAEEVVRLHPDCLVAVGIDAIKAMRGQTATIPIVMGTIDADPVKEGLVASLAQPGGNITGLIGIAWELAGKRLELLKEVDPRISRVAVFFDPRSPAGHAHLQEAETAARTVKLQILPMELREPTDLEGAFRSARSARADGLFFVAVGMLNSHRARIIALATEARLPAIYSNVEFVADGGMIGYAPNMVAQFRRAATYVTRILNGAKPQDLPIEQPTQFELVINAKAARAIGVRVPKALLARADRVIE